MEGVAGESLRCGRVGGTVGVVATPGDARREREDEQRGQQGAEQRGSSVHRTILTDRSGVNQTPVGYGQV